MFIVKYGNVKDGRAYTHEHTTTLDAAKASRDNWYDGGAWGGVAKKDLRVWVEDRSGIVLYGEAVYR